MKRKIILGIFFLLFLVGAVGIAYLLVLGGNYPSGADTMCHIYKGNVLYTNLKQGNWYPLYDQYWYNGVQMMRYWAPLPVYYLAACQGIMAGDPLQGYYLFVGSIFLLGALSWMYIGVARKRPYFGCVMGVLWFFMPNNLFALFIEGNLPRSLSMVLLPLFVHFLLCFLFEADYKAIKINILVFTGIVLCHTGYAGMIALAVLLFLLFYRIFMGKTGRSLASLMCVVIPFMLIGIWLYPSLKGGITSTDSSQVMKGFFQDAWISLNPWNRITTNFGYFYFGLAAFLVAVFGLLCSHRKTAISFMTGLGIFFCTTTSAYVVLVKLPGSQYLWMLRFISIALCFILYGLLCWKSLKKPFLALCVLLLVLDVLPSLQLIYKEKGNTTGAEQLAAFSEGQSITKAREVTKQRIALMDESVLGATGPYVATDFGQDNIMQTFGAGWQSAATANNISLLNESMDTGNYLYLFDRSLELGNDTVWVRKDCLQYPELDVSKVKAAAGQVGYHVVEETGGNIVFHCETNGTFGTTCKYNGLGIGKFASLMSLADPDIETGKSDNLSDYTYEELKNYKVIYIAGFTYDNKKEAEKLLKKVARAGVRVVINGDGIPVNSRSRNQEFLGVTCHSIKFKNGYPILNVWTKNEETTLFDQEYTDWNTVYFTGLKKIDGYFYDNDLKLDFIGRTQDDIYFIGLNLTYHYHLTGDMVAGEIFQKVTGNLLNPLPKREIVPLQVEYGMDEITVTSPKNNVNTSLAYHDNFVFSQKAKEQHKLVVVDKGRTKITMKYPYLWQGLLLSLAGVIVMILFFRWLNAKYLKKEESQEGEPREVAMEELQKIGVLIPALNPGQELIPYVEELIQSGFHNIILVDDGSTENHKAVFATLEKKSEVTVLTHQVNKGKGRGLKTGFTYCLEQEDLLGVVTADSDGQHGAKDVVQVAYELLRDTNKLVLGSRCFTGKDVPWKSSFGNITTARLFGLLYGVKIMDTQTGLRGIGREHMQEFVSLKGERFEYEIRMLIYAARQKITMKEVAIETIYVDGNSETHFRPIVDSFKIYRVMFGMFFGYMISSLSSSIIDSGMFSLFYYLIFAGVLQDNRTRVLVATVLARVISSIYNFLVNQFVVFKAKGNLLGHGIRYFSLVIVQMACSAGLVALFNYILPIPAVVIKLVVDTCLFLISFQIQQRFIFTNKKK